MIPNVRKNRCPIGDTGRKENEMTVAEFRELLESLDYDIDTGELCFEDADELARKYCYSCLETEIANTKTMRNEFPNAVSAFIEETKRIQKMVRTATSWKDFIKNLKYHVKHLETCMKEVMQDEFSSINPQDYLDSAEYWLSVLG